MASNDKPDFLSRQSPGPFGRIDAPQRRHSYSKYDKVEVLLLQWEEDDVGFDTEILELDRLLSGLLNFTTYVRHIPSEGAEDYLRKTILEFRLGKGSADLLMVYYGGHITGSANECTWIANKTTLNSPTLNWLSVQKLLLGYPADVLLVLDYCFAAHAAKSSVRGNWLLGTSARESKASGVSWRHFTRALILELERRAESHKINGQPFTVQSIYGSLLIWERDLDVTPILTRLTNHECDPTDLTPLFDSRDQPYRKFAPQPSQPRRFRPPWISSSAQSTIEASRGYSAMVRMSGLPPSSSHGDVVRWLSNRLGKDNIAYQVGPLTGSQSSSTIVTFSSVTDAEQALKIHDRLFRPQFGGEEAIIRLDNHFLGLSCLYSSLRFPLWKSTVDFVFVHGTDGHAIDSFGSLSINPIRETLWPCTAMPNVLEEAGIYPRVLTFGWAANDWLDPHQDNESLSEACGILRRKLDRERSGCINRPMIFVGHGVGGLLVKQTVLDIINSPFIHENTVKVCFFFAVPHQSYDGDGFPTILAKMDTVVRYNQVPSFSRVSSLRSRNEMIITLSRDFDNVCKQYRIHTHCFYEAQPTGNEYIVPQKSAILDRTFESSHRVDANFQDIVQLGKSEANLRQVLETMRDTIEKKMSPRRPRRPMSEKRNVYARLCECDTVLVVDDSSSMAGLPWSMTSKILAEIVTVILSYDEYGVDVRLFNTYLRNQKRLNIDRAELVIGLLEKVTPHGSTPIAKVLKDELIRYLEKLMKNRNRKSLNLIIFTDGQPDNVRAVERVIGDYAEDLRDIKAHPLQVGVQFVQIGGDEDASGFFRSLDNCRMKKRNWDRGMVNTVHWNDEDEHWLHEKILLGGILQRLEQQFGNYHGSSPQKLRSTMEPAEDLKQLDEDNGYSPLKPRSAMEHRENLERLDKNLTSSMQKLGFPTGLGGHPKRLDGHNDNSSRKLRSVMGFGDVDGLCGFLDSHFEDVAVDEFVWLHELKSLGYESYEIAELLLDDLNKSPWIFLKQPPPRIVSIRPDYHFPNCVHQGGQKSSLSPRLITNDLENTKDLQRIIAESCGLAGVVPKSRDHKTWTGVVEFSDEGLSTALITYDVVDSIRDVVPRVYEALEYFCGIASYLQRKGLCCNSFTVLCFSSIKGCKMIELRTVEFVLALDLFLELQILVKDWENAVLVSKYLPRLNELANKIIRLVSDNNTHAKNDATSFHGCIDAVALAVQILNLGIYLYTQAHIGPIHPYFIVNSVSQVYLLGMQSAEHGYTRAPIRVRQARLTCMAGVTGDAVNVFQLQQLADPSFTGQAFDLLAAPASLAETWDAWGVIIDANTQDEQGIYAIEVGEGYITATGETCESEDPAISLPKLHWSREEPSLRFTVPFSLHSKALIGTVVVNLSCPADENQSWICANVAMSTVGTMESYWQRSEVQAGLQGGQFAGAQLNTTWVKRPGVTLKHIHLRPDISLPFLQSDWGLQISYCTGVARRVSLCVLLADIIPVLMDELLQQPPGWNSLRVNHHIVDALKGSDFKAWFDRLIPELQNDVLRIVRYVLIVLQDTGIDHSGDQLVAIWPRRGSPLGCFKIPCKDVSFWARMLKDSSDCATFTYITPLCLETHHWRCQNLQRAPWHCRSVVLSTAVSLHQPGKATADQWELRHERSYLIGQPGNYLVGKVSILHTAATQYVPPHLDISRSRLPAMVQARIKEHIREKQWTHAPACGVMVSAKHV